MSQLFQIRKPTQHQRQALTADNTSGSGPRVYLETMGCQMNEADSALILGQLVAHGYTHTREPGDADVILINTCAVREKAEERVYGRTSQLLVHRQQKPNLVFGITGCMAEHLREKLIDQAPHIQIIAGPDSYRGIASLVDQARTGETAVDVHLDRYETYEGLDGMSEDNGVSGQITVQRGCDKFCTFCVVPYTRGRERGIAPREILRQARQLAAKGYRELVLLGQTVNSYRWEDIRFADLLYRLAEIDGIARIRFTSPYPVDFSDDLIEAIAAVDQISPYLHLPVQSGSDRMLQTMRRGYTRNEFITLVEKLRERIPDLALSTDVMVGFCGETEEDHEQTLSLLQQIRFDSAFMFRYSDRGITYAARKMQDDVTDEVKAKRLHEVIELQEYFTRASHQARIGHVEEVLITGLSRRGNCLVGRSARFQNVLLPLDAGHKGELVKVRINDSTGHSLRAN